MFSKRSFLDDKLVNELHNSNFEKYYDFLIKENQKVNLTRIVEKDDVYYKHFYDSIILHKYFDTTNKTLLDVGAGAGFPSIPLKIVQDSLKITIIDSLNKRIKFLNDLIDLLNLNNVELIHGRAEEHKKHNYYDFVTSRAVSKLNILAEITLPYVKIGGYFIAYKSITYQEELNEALEAIDKLGGKFEEVIEYQINNDEKHVLIVVRKIHQTDKKYPRNFGLIKKKPL